MSASFVTKLGELGYFNGLSPAAADALKQEFDKQGWLAIFANSHRLFASDAEDLAEGGVGGLLREVSPFLAAQGVTLPAIQDNMSETGDYVVKVGGTTHQMYNAAELRSEDEPGLIWGVSTVRGFRILDQLLAAAGSKERAYAINGGNDLFLMFLTPELHHVIMEHPDASLRDGPYVLKEEYPSFGQPENH